MINRIIEFSAHNRVLIFLMTAVLTLGGWYSLKSVPLDAIPDLSETQVIIYSQWDRSPDIIEDQVTYPIITALLGAPRIKDIRGFSDFGFSYVYAIFEEGTDPYWARSRTLEYLSKISGSLPDGVKTELGPDATGVGWVFQYALVDESGTHDLAEIRSYQDWFLRYVLQTVPGVAEVASIGGFEKQYQVKVKPNALLAYNISLAQIAQAIRENNNEVGARLIEIAGAEYMIRGRGYIKKIADIENIVVSEAGGTPVFVKNLATVTLGPQMRRGVADLDGRGDCVGGIVIMRYGENALNVIERVKKRLEEVRPNLPAGIKLITTYDRSDLIKRAVATLTDELVLEMIIVALVILIFLLHIPSALIPILTMPLAVLISFIPISHLGITSNIMSLGGIAIAIGAMVDAAIVVVENTHKHMEEWHQKGKPGNVQEVVLNAIKEVGPASFYSLLVIAVSFLPIFALEAQEGRLFKPLAYTKNLSMLIAAFLAITLDPALRISFTHFTEKKFKPNWLCQFRNTILVGKMYPEEQHPISRWFFRFYGPVVDWVVDHRYHVTALALLILVATLPLTFKLGSEFMPPLNEGNILYMPTTMPGMGVTQAQELLTRQNKILKSFPEIERVYGKAGRAQTSTDPAPFSMIETVAILRPQEQWRPMKRWYSGLPAPLKWPFTLITPEVMSWEELIAMLDAKMQFPGVTNAWTLPIRARIDMLTTGIRTPVGIKVMGQSLEEVEQIGLAIEEKIRAVEGTRSVFAERIGGGHFLDFNFNRAKLARYGLTVAAAQETLMAAVGGEVITQTIEGRERYGINLRYPHDFRSNPEALKKVLIATPSGAQIPVGEIATLEFKSGPSMIRNENGMLSSFVYIDIANIDIGTYVQHAKKFIEHEIKLPPGITLSWSGQYENMMRVKDRLRIIVPLTLFLILLLIYFNTKSWIKTSIILLAVPFSAIGAIWCLYLLDYHMSIAVWVGLIALVGVDAETGIFMLLYLDLSYQKALKQHTTLDYGHIKLAIHEGAAKRIRPKVMTVATLLFALLPILWASSLRAGADVMKRIAAPMFGGVISSFALELLLYPAIFALWKWDYERRRKKIKE